MAKKLSRQAFVKRVHDTIKQYDMLHPGDAVLAAVSGGSDSVCLLSVLSCLKDKLGIKIAAANMDHCIRGAESAGDSAFVKKLCADLNVECVHKRIPVVVKKGEKCSIEEMAREKRYAFFIGAARRTGSNVIATGHTLDDQAETVLMRFLTGSSLKGMAGIPPVRNEKDLKIIRPLIGADKREIKDYLENVGLKYRHDSTNDEKDYLRNKVRIDVLPFLEKYNPQIKRTMVNFCEGIREDVDLIDAVKRTCVKNVPGILSGNSLQIKDILLQPVAVRKEIFKEYFTRAGGNVKKLTYRHWKDMERFIRTSQKGKSLDFPGNVRVLRLRDTIEFQKRNF